jgi:hypothetical protein
MLQLGPESAYGKIKRPAARNAPVAPHSPVEDLFTDRVSARLCQHLQKQRLLLRQGDVVHSAPGEVDLA